MSMSKYATFDDYIKGETKILIQKEAKTWEELDDAVRAADVVSARRCVRALHNVFLARMNLKEEVAERIRREKA